MFGLNLPLAVAPTGDRWSCRGGRTSGGRQLDVVDLTEAGREDGRRRGVVAEPVGAVGGLGPVDADHEVTASQDLDQNTGASVLQGAPPGRCSPF